LFERKFFISELTDKVTILENFQVFHFHSAQNFIDLCLAGTMPLNRIVIFVKPQSQQYIDIMVQAKLHESYSIYIVPDSEASYQSPFKTITYDRSFYHPSNNKRPLYGIHLSYDRFQSDIETCLELYNKEKSVGGVLLTLDAASFESAPMSELHRMEFMLNQLVIWSRAQRFHIKKYTGLQVEIKSDDAYLLNDPIPLLRACSKVDQLPSQEDVEKVFAVIKMNQDVKVLDNLTDLYASHEVMKAIMRPTTIELFVRNVLNV
jgi:hypothetical protein